ncbi:MAG: NAD(P)/FAD-dependent oxidoreductase [Candidatus Thorarchaeota archaeon]|nr:NAD(P)/FAD-dependent oxidoreductase [Candidatus Thorarchaeota archaeon]
MYDVAIVGAGPAGSTTARFLAKLGHDVVLLDKDKFPRDKPCGGGFSYGIIDEFSYLKSRERDFLKGICKVGVLHSPNRRTVLRGKVDMAVALRYDFDRVLYESAKDVGTETMTGLRVKSVSNNAESVELSLHNGQCIRAKSVIGCDGVGSLVARKFGLHKRWPSNMITACRVAEIPEKESYIDDIYSTDKEYHFYANIGGLPGYGWIFPKQDTINVGLGIVGTHAQGLPGLFRQFIKMLKKDELIPNNADLSNAKGALVPTGGTIKQTVANRCILVGDSAGMVSPLTGGGIHYAMRAAKMAASVTSQGLELDSLDLENLMKYQTMWQSDFGKDFGPMLLAQKIFTGNFTDLLFEIGKRDQGIQMMVSEAMAESSDAGIDVPKLLARTLWVILRNALHI